MVIMGMGTALVKYYGNGYCVYGNTVVVRTLRAGFRHDLHNHKINANIIIYSTKTAYVHAEQNNRLFSLGQVYDLDFGLHRKQLLVDINLVKFKTHTLPVQTRFYARRWG